ncbi:Uma2 family endonuclease [Actinoplanes sp. NPDC049596]|uniref:Uma2 family endonuclease n=1 Tax=unclassified Actinoplanes TaxID=2626549 RepID=UPI0034383CBE
MTLGSRLTIDDVADFPEEFRFELLDGKAVRRPSPLPSHQVHMSAVVTALDRRAPDDHIVSFGLAIEIDAHNMPFVDVVAMRAEAAGHSPVPAAGVTLAVEVIAPWSEALDRGPKKWLYARAGIPFYWLVDSTAEQVTLTQFQLGRGGRYHRRLHTAAKVTVDQPWEATLDLPALTRTRERIRAAARVTA